MANIVGYQGPANGKIGDIHSSALNPVLTERDVDNQGRVIYLKGIGSTVAGSIVTYDENGITALVTADAVGPVAVATAATVASTWGWYYIVSPSGGVLVESDDVADNTPVYIDGTNGRGDDAVVAGDVIRGMFFRGEDSGGFALAQFNRPYVNNIDG